MGNRWSYASNASGISCGLWCEKMVKPLALSLRVLAILAVMVVRVVASVVECAAELFGIAAFEVLVPALRGLQRAQERLESKSEGEKK